MKRLADAAFNAEGIHAAFLLAGVAQVDRVFPLGRGAAVRLRGCLPRRARVEARAMA